MKTCKKCGCTDFYISNGKPSNCKQCIKEYSKLPEVMALHRINNKKYASKEVVKEKRKQWSEKNRDAINKAANERRTFLRWENRERPVILTKEQKKEKRKIYIANNIEKIREQKRIRMAVRRTSLSNNGGNFTKDDVDFLLKSQKCLCIVCKTNISKNYHIDHILPIKLGGTSDKYNLQLLCPRCNISKTAKHPFDFMRSKGFLL